MRRLMVLIAPVAVLGLLAQPAGAAFNPCDQSDNTVVGESTNGPFYIDVRYVGQPYGEMVWVYQETNGTDGLQRGGAAFLGGYSDQCQESNTPDRLLY